MKAILAVLFLTLYIPSFAQITCYGVAEGLPTDNVKALEIDKNGRVYVVYNGADNGISYIENGVVTNLSFDTLRSTSYGNNLAIDSKGTVYYPLTGIDERIITFNGVNFDTMEKTKIGLISGNQSWVHIDKQDRLWLATLDGLCVYDGDTVIKYPEGGDYHFDRVVHVNSDDQGRVFISDYPHLLGGFYMLENDKWKHFRNPELTALNIGPVIGGVDGEIWAGTIGSGNQDQGVIRLDSNGQTFFRDRDGLPGNGIRSLFKDDQDRIWVGTRKGLAMYSNDNWQKLTLEDGIIGENVSYIRQNPVDGHIWFSTIGGVCEIDVDQTFSARSIHEGQSKMWTENKMLHLPELHDFKELKIYNLQGQLVYQAQDQNRIYDLSTLPTGQYTAVLYKADSVYTDKIMLY